MRALKHCASRTRRGLSLLELAIAVVISATLFGAAAITVLRADAAYREAEVGAEAERLCEQTLERLAREFMNAERASLALTPAAPLPSTLISFRRAEGLAGGLVQLGDQRRVRFQRDAAELGDGADNDGDGLVDEGALVLTIDVAAGTDVVLVNGVARMDAGEVANGLDDDGDGLVDEPGFFAQFDAATGTLTFNLTLERRAPRNRRAVRSGQIAVRVRNG